MKLKLFFGAIAIVAISIFLLSTQHTDKSSQNHIESKTQSSYVGEETRSVKSLSDADIDGLRSGAGTPFNGMAKPAELNGYPGPRHILDAVEANELTITPEQETQIVKLYEEMVNEAIPLGEKIIALETEIDTAFRNGSMTEPSLKKKIDQSAETYANLRFTHLKYHLLTVNILTAGQVSEYNTIRGYGSNDPCQTIPAGHDSELWKLHNNCP